MDGPCRGCGKYGMTDPWGVELKACWHCGWKPEIKNTMNKRAAIYKRLGFDECRAPMPKDRPGFAPGCGSSRLVWDFGLLDRLRILWSGRIMVDMAHQMDRVPKRFETTSAVSVLPPE